MVRSDRLECGRKLGIKEKTQLQPSAWWKERSVQIGKAVPDYPQKAGSAARVLAAGKPKQAGLFAEKEEWSAVHSDVG